MQLLRAVLHQLREREAAAAVQPARLQAGAGGVREVSEGGGGGVVVKLSCVMDSVN